MLHWASSRPLSYETPSLHILLRCPRRARGSNSGSSLTYSAISSLSVKSSSHVSTEAFTHGSSLACFSAAATLHKALVHGFKCSMSSSSVVSPRPQGSMGHSSSPLSRTRIPYGTSNSSTSSSNCARDVTRDATPVFGGSPFHTPTLLSAGD